MIKIEAETLEGAYKNAALALECSVTELNSEVLQHPKNGYLGMFKKTAIIVAEKVEKQKSQEPLDDAPKEEKKEQKKIVPLEEVVVVASQEKENSITQKLKVNKVTSAIGTMFNHTVKPTVEHKEEQKNEEKAIVGIAQRVKKEINELFDLTCFEIEKIEVSVYDDETLLVEFKGVDAALLIGKEGYRYKAISYMIFNWINTNYKVQLRLEIAEFLKNQEESMSRYIQTICEIIDDEGRAQTKILDGVLVQIALKELRQKYPEKYVVIRSTKDGLKYIIVNDYHTTT